MQCSCLQRTKKSLPNCTPLQQQFLSVLDCCVDVARWHHGLAHGQYARDSLLDHPLIMWDAASDCCSNRDLLTSALEPVLQVLMQHNTVVHFA